jgi:hypothetical protein
MVEDGKQPPQQPHQEHIMWGRLRVGELRKHCHPIGDRWIAVFFRPGEYGVVTGDTGVFVICVPMSSGCLHASIQSVRRSCALLVDHRP